MEEKVIVLSVKPYSFTNSDNVKQEGCTVHYYPAETLDKIYDASTGVYGAQPLKASMPYDFVETVKNVGIPCKASVSYVMRSVQGQMVLKPDKIVFLDK